MISRRQFLWTAAAACGAGAGAGIYTWQLEPHWLEIVRRPLPIRRLPAALDGTTLAQLSDIHVGRRVSDDYVLDTFRRVAALTPDIVVYTGDFTSHHRGIFDQADRVYAQAPRGRFATIGIPGNHDYGPGWAHPEILARMSRILATHGIEMLRNQVTDVRGLQIAGMDDLWGTALRPAVTLAQLNRQRAALVLSHNPDSVDLPEWDGYDGWILSGHTHGGQCKPPFLPPPLLPVQNRRYTAGKFELAGGRHLYVNRGVGHLTQVRFNVRPEVTVFQLRTTEGGQA